MLENFYTLSGIYTDNHGDNSTSTNSCSALCRLPLHPRVATRRHANRVSVKLFDSLLSTVYTGRPRAVLRQLITVGRFLLWIGTIASQTTRVIELLAYLGGDGFGN